MVRFGAMRCAYCALRSLLLELGLSPGREKRQNAHKTTADLHRSKGASPCAIALVAEHFHDANSWPIAARPPWPQPQPSTLRLHCPKAVSSSPTRAITTPSILTPHSTSGVSRCG